jgi:riboflavin kinase/FMN adenylyltransferase
VKLLRHFSSGPPLALAIGNFDGVHVGHHTILARTVAVAADRGWVPAAMSFHPLPREFFARRAGAALPARLMSTSEKLAAFDRIGISRAYIPRFDHAFAAQSPNDFIGALRAIDLRWLAVGADFRFGAKRAGDVAMLESQGDFEVEVQGSVMAGDTRISSSAIRAALLDGDLNTARTLLGRRYAIVGRVVHGRKLGRTLGFPTINIGLTGRKPALAGVYAVQCRLVTRGLEGVAGQAGTILNGVANLGTNPVVSSENRQHLEVFLFDFSSDLYGQRVEVTFIEKIRDELNLPSLEALVVQMHDDARRAKDILRMMNDAQQG